MKIIISILIMMCSFPVLAQNYLSPAEIKAFKQFFTAETPNCGGPGAGCRTYTDCCRGYCDGTHRCSNDGTGNETCIPDGAGCQNSEDCCSNLCDTTGVCVTANAVSPGKNFLCALSGQACRMNMDCCNSWCKIEQVCF